MTEAGRIVVGIDEAGYGPSMGPLVLGATAWYLPSDMPLDDIWDCFSPLIQPKPAFPKFTHIPIGDSKELLKGKYGWANLSLGAEWMFQHSLQQPASVSQILKELSPLDYSRLTSVAWYKSLAELQVPAPGQIYPYLDDPIDGKYGHAKRHEVLQTLSSSLSKLWQDSGVKLLGIQARVIDEPEFNARVTKLGNKSTLLSELSLDLAKSLLTSCIPKLNLVPSDLTGAQVPQVQYSGISSNARPEPIQPRAELFFDKHGGRVKYQSLLMECFDGTWFHIIEESQGISRYQSEWNGMQLAAQFMAKGDSLLPSASASVLAKWLREVSMASLNHFWQSHHPRPLKVTAGYYVDAVRYTKEIEETASKLNISKDLWWRCK